MTYVRANIYEYIKISIYIQKKNHIENINTYFYYWLFFCFRLQQFRIVTIEASVVSLSINNGNRSGQSWTWCVIDRNWTGQSWTWTEIGQNWASPQTGNSYQSCCRIHPCKNRRRRCWKEGRTLNQPCTWRSVKGRCCIYPLAASFSFCSIERKIASGIGGGVGRWAPDGWKPFSSAV